MSTRTVIACILALTALPYGIRPCHGQTRDEALAAAVKATTFLHEKVSTEGGYLWRYSADLTLGEGEGVVTTKTVWVQPPGTPAVGEAFVRLYEATGEQVFLDAALAAADALRRGQMRSGGWQARVEFEPDRRRKWAYRIDPPGRKRKDQSSLDDDQTQSALRFVMQLDRALEFKNEQVHDMAMYGLKGLLEKGQFPNGAFPQVWTSDERDPKDHPIKQASYPETWSRKYTGHHNYWYRYTLNDNLVPDVIDTLYLAHEIYNKAPHYADAAEKAADFLLLAQMPYPQPAWAQQYSYDMHPIWARKFEPPAITGAESQGAIRALLKVFHRTGEQKYLAAAARAARYLDRCELPDGRLARFYELKTNRPLYLTRDYELTHDDSDTPTHYAFKVGSRARALVRMCNDYAIMDPLWLKEHPHAGPGKPRRRVPDVRPILAALDERGAWVTDTGLRYHKREGAVIDMAVAVENLNALAEFLSGK